MLLKKRLEKLERFVKQSEDKVYIADADKELNHMSIPGLNFNGTIEEGRQLMDQRPNSVFIIDDIPRTGMIPDSCR